MCCGGAWTKTRGTLPPRDFGNSIFANLPRHDTVVAVPFAGY
jgi:hypothetical protein